MAGIIRGDYKRYLKLTTLTFNLF